MRKLIFIAISVCVTLYSCAEKNGEIKISASLLNYPDNTMVVLRNFETNKIVDTTYIINNKFKLNLVNTKPAPYAFFIGDTNPEILPLFIEDVDITIKGEKGNVKFAEVDGGVIQKQQHDYLNYLKPHELKKDSLQKELMLAFKNQDKDKLKELGQLQMEIVQEGFDMMASYIEKKPDELYSAFTLKHLLAGIPKSKIKDLYENLSPSVRESDYANSVAQWLKLHKEAKVGDIAENFTLLDINGNKVSLNDFKGKFVLLEFWKVGCSGCIKENENLQEEYEKYKEKNFDIISISKEPNMGDLKKMSPKYSITWHSLQDVDSQNGNVSNIYGVLLVPSNFLIDPTGQIIAKDLKGDVLKEKLKQIL